MLQLQELLDECIKRGWKPFNLNYRYINIVCDEYEVEVNIWEEWSPVFSYHDLFSVESWLMEFVDWKEWNYTLPIPLAHYVNMCQMTAEQKVQYFLDNALLPTK